MLYSYLFSLNSELLNYTANETRNYRISRANDFLVQIPYHLIDWFINDK